MRKDQKQQENPKPRVGVGVLIFKNDKILLGKRTSSHGKGEFATPGGHLEYMESFENCARRETLEECGIEIANVRFQYLSNVVKYGPKHYIHIGLIAEWKKNEPQNLEPDKCESWDWYDFNNLPQPLFFQSRMAIENYKSGVNYQDIQI